MCSRETAAGKELKWPLFSSDVPVNIIPDDCAPKTHLSPPFWTANGYKVFPNPAA